MLVASLRLGSGLCVRPQWVPPAQVPDGCAGVIPEVKWSPGPCPVAPLLYQPWACGAEGSPVSVLVGRDHRAEEGSRPSGQGSLTQPRPAVLWPECQPYAMGLRSGGSAQGVETLGNAS